MMMMIAEVILFVSTFFISIMLMMMMMMMIKLPILSKFHDLHRKFRILNVFLEKVNKCQFFFFFFFFMRKNLAFIVGSVDISLRLSIIS